MKALVAIKRVVDYRIHIQVNKDGTGIDETQVKMSMNPFCEIAVEAAVQLKEQKKIDEIIAVSIGPSVAQEQLRSALAIGADSAILIESDLSQWDPLSIAKGLQAVIEQEKPELVLLGKQAIDTDHNQTGQMLAGLMGWSQGTFASEILIQEGNKIQVTREVDEGLSVLELKMPAVLTTDLRLNVPRYVSLPNLIQAKKKPLKAIQASELNINIKQTLVTKKIKAPQVKQAGVEVSSVEALVDLLKNKEKVIT